MSDYCYAKVMRFRITPELVEKLGLKNESDIEKIFPKDDLFVWGFGDKYDYVDYVLESSYGEVVGDFGNVRKPTEEEYDLYWPKFKELLKLEENDKSKLCYLEYCYYNCAEPNDYYQTYETEYEFLVFIKTEYVRDAQGYFGKIEDDSDIYYDVDAEKYWKDVSGPTLIWQGRAKNEEEVLSKIHAVYDTIDDSVLTLCKYEIVE